MVEITWNKNIEPEYQTEIENYLTPFLFLVPKWTQLIHINLWDKGDSDGEMISISVNYEYRAVSIHFNCAWLNQAPELKQQQVVHELVHISLALIADYARDSFDLLCPESDEGKFNKHLQKELAARHESATQDLAYAIYNQFCPIK